MLSRHVLPKPKIRAFPWPYRAMLAISTDIDGAKIELFRDLHRYVNSKAEDTRFGPGLGLDLADSFWFYERAVPQAATATYFADLAGTRVNPWAGELVAYIRAGWIDTLHTYGNFNQGGFSVELAERALAVAEANRLRFPVWVDHGNPNNIQNVFHQQAEIAARHLPFMRKLGVEFVADPAMKGDFGKASVIQPAKLADGRPIWSFERSCRVNDIEDKDAFLSQISERFRSKVKFRSSEGGLSSTVWHPPYLNAQISRQRLANLAARGGFVIIGQHLGYAPAPQYITNDFLSAMRRLAMFQEQGRILVASTARLLRFHVARDYLDYSIKQFLETTTITIHGIKDPVRGKHVPDPAELAGIQFLIPTTKSVRLFINRVRVPHSWLFQREESDGVTLVGFRWHEADHTDYVREYAPPLAITGASPAAGRAREVPMVATDTLTDVYRNLRERAVPAHLDKKRLEYCVDRGLELFRRGLDHYQDVLGRLGFDRGERLLDVGCGSAHWLLAALPGYGSVHGVDISKEYVFLGQETARAFDLGERLIIAEGSALDLPFKDGHFDHVLCHSVMHFLDTELALAEIARVLAPGGALYCGVTGPGARLFTSLNSVMSGRDRDAETQLRNFLGGALRRAGAGRPHFATVRALNPEEYIDIAGAYGLVLSATPDEQDVIRGYPNFPGTFDFVVTKPRDPISRQELFRRRQAASGLAAGDFLDSLLASQLPRLAREAVEKGWCDVDRETRRRIVGMAELATSETPKTSLLNAARATMEDGPLRSVFDGLGALADGRIAEALKSFVAAGDHRDAPFLAASCLLRLRKPAAYRRFQGLTKHHPDRLWAWAGLLMAAVQSEDAEMRRACGQLVRDRLTRGLVRRI